MLLWINAGYAALKLTGDPVLAAQFEATAARPRHRFFLILRQGLWPVVLVLVAKLIQIINRANPFHELYNAQDAIYNALSIAAEMACIIYSADTTIHVLLSFFLIAALMAVSGKDKRLVCLWWVGLYGSGLLAHVLLLTCGLIDLPWWIHISGLDNQPVLLASLCMLAGLAAGIGALRCLAIGRKSLGRALAWATGLVLVAGVIYFGPINASTTFDHHLTPFERMTELEYCLYHLTQWPEPVWACMDYLTRDDFKVLAYRFPHPVLIGFNNQPITLPFYFLQLQILASHLLLISWVISTRRKTKS